MGKTETEQFFEHAKVDLAPKMMSSSFVLTINPAEAIDPKVAIETGYAVLLNKPMLVVTHEGEQTNPGLERIAHKIVKLTSPLNSMESQMLITAACKEMLAEIRDDSLDARDDLTQFIKRAQRSGR